MASAAFTDSPLTVTAWVTGGPQPDPAMTGQEALTALSATVDNPPVPQEELQIDGPVWGWLVETVEYRATAQDTWAPVTEGFTLTIEHPSTGSPDALLHANYESAGEWRATLRVNVEYVAPETGERWSGNDLVPLDAPVVEHRPGSIWGKVTDATTGQPTSLVMVTCHEKNGGAEPSFTGIDANGYYDFHPVATGEYIVTAGQAIWASSTPDKYEFVFQEGQSARCDFVMHRWTMNRSLEIIEPHTNPIGGGQSARMRVSWREHVDPPKHIKLYLIDLTVPSLPLGAWEDRDLGDEGAAITAFNAQPQGDGMVMGELGDPWMTTNCFNDDFLVKAEVDFENPWNEGDPHEEATKAANVRNLVIHGVQTSSGNADCLVYDSDPASGLSTPWLSFEIVDEAQTAPSSYTWTVTGLRGLPFVDTVNHPQPIRLDLDPTLLGQGRGVLTFEIHVEKGAGPDDQQWFRQPYHLTVPFNELHFERRDGAMAAIGRYRLNDDRPATELNLWLFNPLLALAGAAEGPLSQGDPVHEVTVASLSDETGEPGYYTLVETGQDGHGSDSDAQAYREHQNKRLYPAQTGAAVPAAYLVASDGDYSWLFDSAVARAHAELENSNYLHKACGYNTTDIKTALDRKAAVFLYVGHSDENALGFVTTVLVHDDLNGIDVSKLRLAMLHGCWTARGADNWLTAFSSRGTDCVVGWRSMNPVFATPAFQEYFWLLALHSGLSVQPCVVLAAQAAFDSTGQIWSNIFSYDFAGDTNLTPAGYGSP